MGYFYYGVWVLFLIHSIYYLTIGRGIYKEIVDDTKKMKAIKEDAEGGEILGKNTDFALKKGLKYISMSVILIFVFIWQLLGLFGFNWFIFLSLTLAGFFINVPITKLIGNRVGIKSKFSWCWGVMRVCVIVFAIVNAFHLRIDTHQWFLNLFS